jgi:uncharacterized protein (TIGR02452 family)
MSDLLGGTLQLTRDAQGLSVVLNFDRVTTPPALPGSPAIEVTDETTQDAALRFRGKQVTVLNFASGVMPGGGVRIGASAQEEALCLCSGLLPRLEAQMGFYNRNRLEEAPQECYDHMIWCDRVPLIRDGQFNLVDPMDIRVITYPAPNKYRRAYAGQGRFSEEPIADDYLQGVFQRRTIHVVRHAAEMKTEVLILGAWGCGAYGNDPGMVAQMFKAAIGNQSGPIERVVFAIYGQGSVGTANRDAFGEVFAG